MLNMKSYRDVVLIRILDDYRCNFHGKSCVITTNYVGLKEFTVSFHEDDLPHLIGLHYVSKERRAGKIIKEIDNGKLTAKSIMNHSEFGAKDIKNRILLYPFIHEVFVKQSIKLCVPMENVKPNNMKLICVFTKWDSNLKEEIILGLKRDHQNGIFKIATLHSRKKAHYTCLKCSKVLSMIWA